MTTPRLADRISAWGGNTRTYTSPETGDQYPSITTVLRLGMPKHLDRWQASVIATAAVDETDFWHRQMRSQAKRQGHTPEQLRQQRIDWLKNAANRVRDTAGTKGDGAHDYLEARMVRARIGDVKRAMAEGFAPVIDRWIERWTPKVIATEFTVISDTYGYAGTGDLICWIPGYGVVLIDAKTSKRIWPETALQLAAIRHADYICERKGTDASPKYVKSPIPETPGGSFALHLRPDCITEKCRHRDEDPCEGEPEGFANLIPVEAGEESFSVFLGALGSAKWAKVGSQKAVGQPARPPMLLPSDRPATFADELRNRVKAIVTGDNEEAIDMLHRMWEDSGVITFKKAKKKKHTFTHDELEKLSTICSLVEAMHGLPFQLPAMKLKEPASHKKAVRALPLPPEIEEAHVPKGSKPIDEAQAAELQGRLVRLADDIEGAVRQQYIRHSVWPTKYATRRQLLVLRHFLEIGEAVARARMADLDGVVASVSDEEHLSEALFATSGVDLKPYKKRFKSKLRKALEAMTEQEVYKFCAITTSLSKGYVKTGVSDPNLAKRLVLAREQMLLRAYDSKNYVRIAARKAAVDYAIVGFTARSCRAVAEDPMVSSLLMWGYGDFQFEDDVKAAEAELRKIEKQEAKADAEYALADQ